MSAVVAGKSSAVPIGTSAMIGARTHTAWVSGYSTSPSVRQIVPTRIVPGSPSRRTIGPSRSERITSERVAT